MNNNNNNIGRVGVCIKLGTKLASDGGAICKRVTELKSSSSSNIETREAVYMENG